MSFARAVRQQPIALKATSQVGLNAAHRIFILALAMLLLQAGIAWATHYHSLHAVVEKVQPVECALCVDANHLGVPGPQSLAPVATFAWLILVLVESCRRIVLTPHSFYRARGPPRL